MRKSTLFLLHAPVIGCRLGDLVGQPKQLHNVLIRIQLWSHGYFFLLVIWMFFFSHVSYDFGGVLKLVLVLFHTISNFEMDIQFFFLVRYKVSRSSNIVLFGDLSPVVA